LNIQKGSGDPVNKKFGNTTKLIALLALSALVLSGCTKPNPVVTTKPKPKPTPVVIEYQTAPLTGFTYVKGAPETVGLGLPPVSCKIDNAAAGRPQYNLNKTDIVFVEMVEGGLTRLVATWHSQAVDKVGPVRSIRPMDADIVAPYGGVFCFSGGLSQFVSMMRETGLYMADETSERDAPEDSFSRTKEKSAPHNLVVNMALLQSQHADRGGAGAMFTYSEYVADSEITVPDPKTVKEIQELRIYLATLQTGTPTTDVTIKYPMATSYWAGDGAGNLLRTQDKAPHLDAVTNDQVRAKNVVVMEVEIDNTYGQIPKTVMVSSGAAWVFQDGKRFEGTWSKSSQASPIELLDGSGAVIKLLPGNTWIELKPVKSTITITSP
jgi:hypothetical protein